MTEPSSRRAFFTRAWRDALSAAPQVGAAALPGAGVRRILGEAGAQPAETPAFTGFPGRPTVHASPVHDTATVDELLDRAAELGLAPRRESIASLARRSVRLVPVSGQVAAGRSRLGDPLVRIDLAELTALGLGTGLPADGLLEFHCDISDQGSRWRGVQDTGVRLDHVPESELEPAWSAGAAMTGHLQMSVELSLPRVWSAPVEALDLDDSEQAAWQTLRLWLAGRQGVELFDQTDGHLAVHRLFGYPDERTGEMPLICELVAAWAEVGVHPHAHPMAPQLAPLAGRWRLLLQLSATEGVTWPWAGRYERLYFWIDEDQLEAGDLSGVVAVAQ